LARNRRIVERIVPSLTVVFLLLSLSSTAFDTLMGERRLLSGPIPLKSGVPDETDQFLRLHSKPGDTVQPLDWTGGAVHGMLMARAKLSTRFIYDFHFYHHISNPYIIRLRQEFLSELGVKKPRFVIQVLGKDKPWPSGLDTTQEFPELQAFLDQYYTTAQSGSTYRILERREE
jgi:hypothetical protein